MTIPSAPAQETEDYRSKPPAPKEQPPASLPQERGRVALVAGSGSVATDDLYPLLRRRLLILTSIVAGAFFLGFCLDIVLRTILPLPDELAETPLEYLLNSWRPLLNLLVHGTAALILWRRPPRSVRGLRLIEVLAIGTSVVNTLSLAIHSESYGRVFENAGQPFEIRQAFVGRYVLAGSLLWSLLILVYGTLIPNTWRRCAAVVGLMTVSPLVVFAVYAFWLWPLPREIGFQVLMVQGFYLCLAFAIAVFASSRIEILRQQAVEARKLGQYLLRERLGAGGMGEVYRAEHALLRRPCAVKLIRQERAGDPDTLRRFEREVQTTATLTHPNTVQVFDYGHAADGTFYYVMEYLPGLTLEEIIRRDGRLSPGRVVHFLRQVCAALGEAHSRGLTHRDIKPGNVMICERGGVRDVVKLLDFGLVRMPKDDLDGGTLTRDGTVAGTPAYMSPEQAGGHEGIDARSDIYSVGALAYFLLTGKPPFGDRSAVKMIAAHLYEAPAALPADVPVDLAQVVLRCLAKPPADRWPDVTTLDAALSGIAVPAWTARDATAWWEQAARSARETDALLGTAT